MLAPVRNRNMCVLCITYAGVGSPNRKNMEDGYEADQH